MNLLRKYSNVIGWTLLVLVVCAIFGWLLTSPVGRVILVSWFGLATVAALLIGASIYFADNGRAPEWLRSLHGRKTRDFSANIDATVWRECSDEKLDKELLELLNNPGTPE